LLREARWAAGCPQSASAPQATSRGGAGSARGPGAAPGVRYCTCTRRTDGAGRLVASGARHRCDACAADRDGAPDRSGEYHARPARNTTMDSARGRDAPRTLCEGDCSPRCGVPKRSCPTFPRSGIGHPSGGVEDTTGRTGQPSWPVLQCLWMSIWCGQPAEFPTEVNQTARRSPRVLQGVRR
jgi:hypothetical protein